MTVAAISDVAPRTGARVLAVAVMSNHLHIVVQQGDRSLSKLMQPLLRRLAHRIQRAHGFEGPVFWRPYGSTICMTPNHARNAIVYTHLNPLRAGLCDDPAEYRWTSHKLYCEGPSADMPPELEQLAGVLDPSLSLPLFATDAHRSQAQLRLDYQALVDWRIDADQTLDDPDIETFGLEPPKPWRRSTWGVELSPLFHPPGRFGPTTNGRRPFRQLPDMASLARATLAAEAPTVTLASLHGRGGGARASRLRHVIIRRLHAAGFRNVQIARFLGLSESAVSWVLRKRRRDP
jgi:REP element-mobilizing transposase RayT